MMMLTIGDLFTSLTHINPYTLGLGGTWDTICKTAVTDACVDSRKASASSLFVALKGENQDGHDFVASAFQQGAVVAFVHKPLSLNALFVDLRITYWKDALKDSQLILPICFIVEDVLLALQQSAKFWREKQNIHVIGITGSVGKSTTKEAVANVLEQRYPTLRNEGNMNNEIGLPLTLLCLNESHERVVLEMGFYVAGEIKLLCDLAHPSVGIVTNIGTVHAERAGDQEKIALGKTELVQSLPKDGSAVLNYDDGWVRGMAQQTQAKVFFYGLDEQAHLWADQIVGLGLNGIRFAMHYQGKSELIQVPFLGQYSIYTALRAAAVGLLEGFSWYEIKDGLRESKTQIHLKVIRVDSGALIIDDSYNAAPESTLAALTLLNDLSSIKGRKVAVLGDMLELGMYEVQGHESVGISAAQVADELVVVGQRAKHIAHAAHQAGMPNTKIKTFDTSEEAADYFEAGLRKDDVVLIKGSRGMQMEKIVQRLGVTA